MSAPDADWKSHFDRCKAAYYAARKETNVAKHDHHLRESITSADAVLRVFPSYMPALSYKARSLAELNQYQAACLAFDALRDIYSLSPLRGAEWARNCFITAMYYAARSAYAHGDYVRCAACLDDASSVQWLPDVKIDREWFFYLHAKASAKQQNYETAIDSLTFAWQLGCKKDYVYRELAKAFIELRDLERAEQCMRNLSQKDRMLQPNLVILAKVARLSKDFPRASQLLQDGAAQCPPKSRHKLLYEQGLLARDMQDFESARRYLAEANETKMRLFHTDYQDALRELYLLKDRSA